MVHMQPSDHNLDYFMLLLWYLNLVITRNIMNAGFGSYMVYVVFTRHENRALWFLRYPHFEEKRNMFSNVLNGYTNLLYMLSSIF